MRARCSLETLSAKVPRAGRHITRLHSRSSCDSRKAPARLTQKANFVSDLISHCTETFFYSKSGRISDKSLSIRETRVRVRDNIRVAGLFSKKSVDFSLPRKNRLKLSTSLPLSLARLVRMSRGVAAHCAARSGAIFPSCMARQGEIMKILKLFLYHFAGLTEAQSRRRNYGSNGSIYCNMR